MAKRQKIYVYVDESGQDDRSQHFVVTAVVVSDEGEHIREKLTVVEEETQTHGLKWHKTQFTRKIKYLELVLERSLGAGSVFVGSYQKPTLYFFPMLDVLERAIRETVNENYIATVYIDGIDKTIAKKFTNALRSRGITVRLVQSRRDESDPLIRLADMWAGCIRGALLGGTDSNKNKLFRKAKRQGYLKEVQA